MNIRQVKGTLQSFLMWLTWYFTPDGNFSQALWWELNTNTVQRQVPFKYPAVRCSGGAWPQQVTRSQHGTSHGSLLTSSLCATSECNPTYSTSTVCIPSFKQHIRKELHQAAATAMPAGFLEKSCLKQTEFQLLSWKIIHVSLNFLWACIWTHPRGKIHCRNTTKDKTLCKFVPGLPWTRSMDCMDCKRCEPWVTMPKVVVVLPSFSPNCQNNPPIALGILLCIFTPTGPVMPGML